VNNEQLRFGIVGAGAIAQSYAQAFDKCEIARVVAVADVRAQAARALAEGLHCPSFESYQALSQEVQLDAVIICTPPSSHTEIGLYFLDRKVHLLCEKPFTTNSDDARRLLAAAKKNGLVLTMASKFRYVTDVVRAKSMVMSGMIGDIILFENAFTSRVDMSARWNANPAVSGGGVLIDNGTHSVDIMRYFLGPLAEVDVVEGKRSQGLPVDETVRVFVRSVDGVMGSIDLSWSINKELESYINIYGSRGTISVGWRESKYRLSSSRDWVVFGKGYDKLQAFRSQIENFSRTIQGTDKLLINGADALASVEVIEAAYTALKRHRWTAVPAQVAGTAGERQPEESKVLVA
jgi:predicted dehydrogenase